MTVRTDVSCKVFRKIGWSVLDTLQTADEVRRHNARYLTVCRPRPEGAKAGKRSGK